MTLDGASVQAIAKELGVSRTTVYAYQKDQSRGMRTRRPESGRKATLSRANQDELLQAFTGLNCNAAALTFLLHKEPQNFGLEPGFSLSARNVRRYFATRYPDLLKPKAPAYKPFFCEPGQQLQIDFTFGEFRFADDLKPTKVSFFEAVYPWSHKGFVMVCPGTSQPSWMMGISTCLARYGCPAEILCDNDKSLVISNDRKGNVRFHPDFEWMLKPFGIKPRACRPSRPQTKGHVERFGRYFKEQGLAVLQYRNKNIRCIADLQAAIDEWLVEQADERKFDGKTVREWFEQEKQVLVPTGLADEFMPVASRIDMASRNASVHFFGTRIELPAVYAGTWVSITVRHNGEFLVSTLAGTEIRIGTIPIARMQEHKFDDRQADTAPAHEPEQPTKVHELMKGLVGIEGIVSYETNEK